MTPHPPHLYTRAEWDGMSEADRRMVREHRRRAVEWARDDHEHRYPQRGYERLATLQTVLDGARRGRVS